MKKIIDGVRYDTEKATRIGSYSYSNSSDFSYILEELYVTPVSGKYFLACEGGASSPYKVIISRNSWGGGETIKPMDKDEAFAWAQDRLDAEEIEAHFSDMIKDA